MFQSFCEELIKIAQDAIPDPRAQEIGELQENPPDRSKDINKEVLKQKAKNILAIGAGAGLGLGAATATNYGLEQAAKHYGKEMPLWGRAATHGVVVPAMMLGGHYAYGKMREKDRELLEQARQRGEQ